MKKQLVLAVVLGLFLISVVNPCPYSMPLARGIELNEKPFFTAADGDESSESMTSFSETSADDTRLYPDSDSAIGFNELGSSSVLNENETDVVWQDPGPIWWRSYRAGGYSSTGGASNATMIEMWGYKSTPLGPVDIEVCYYLNTSIVLTNDHLFYIKLMAEVAGNYRIGFYNGSTEHYTASFPIAAETWTIITALDLGDIVIGTVSRITVENDPSANYEAGANHSIWVDYHHLTDIPMDTNEDIYAESFADVSDWDISVTEAGESISTDDDVATLAAEGDSAFDRDYFYTISPSVSSWSYFEIRYRMNSIDAYSWTVYMLDADSSEPPDAGRNGYNMIESLTWRVDRWYIDDYDGTWDAYDGSVESVIIQGRNNEDVDTECYVDYLRIGPSTEMGWQHDGSTTAGVGLAPVAFEEDCSDLLTFDYWNGETPSSDGSVITWPLVGNNAYKVLATDEPSFTAEQVADGLYYEYRIDRNASASNPRVRVFAYSNDGRTGDMTTFEDFYLTDGWTIRSGLIPAGYATECYLFYARCASNVELYIDYFYIGNPNQFDDTGTYTSDGDELTLTADADGSIFAIAFDTTATISQLATAYYPFLALDFNDADSSDSVTVETYDGTNCFTVLDNVALGTDPLHTNTKAVETYIAEFWLTVAADVVIRLDWLKAYSIANFTYTDSGAGIDDLLYVSGGVLVSEMDSGYIEINHDPALAVSDTYSIYNLTTSSTAPEFSQYVSGWSAYSEETRGATTSGTVTDIKLKFDSIETISAIKFIEDGTAPDILDKFLDPGEPYDDEPVTITTVAYDAVEVWSCTINAVVYPTGFSDVDYEMTETDQEHVFTYEFSTLTAGYYLFQVSVSDAVHTYEEYISVRVREAEILITTYTFFGASSDFSYMQYSGHINRDCTYNISEWSTTWAKNETHTGSVSEGMFNIAWDKIGVDDAEANFTIVFLNGSLSLTIEGFYGTAYKELRITEIAVENMEESLALTNITINFYTNKDVDWYVYDRDDDDVVLSSGSSNEGSDDLYFLKNRIPYAHYYAVKWTDGVTDIWYNSSYWTYRQNIDSIDPPWADWEAKDQRRTIEFWVTATAIIGGLGLIVLGIMHYGTRQQLKALQLPRYKTQERGER